MKAASSRSEVGIRELKNDLGKVIDRVRTGEEVIITVRGRPVARMSPIGQSTERLAELVAAGVVRAPTNVTRHRPGQRITAKGTMSDLVADQRR